MNSHTTKKQMSAAYRYSYSRLALNYYTFYELMSEAESLPTRFSEYASRFHQLLHAFLEGRVDISVLHDLRKQVIEEVELFTAYSDCFQIYEYVLNRMERRFQTMTPITETTEEFVSRLMDFLMGAKDQLVLNDRIQQIIGQLPVRYTKQKFYSILQDGLTVYIGSDKKSLDRMLYILRTESMACLPEKMESAYPEFYEILEQLRTTDYLHMTPEQYQASADKITYVSKQLIDDIDLYLLFQDLMNDLYVLCLTGPESMIELGEKQTLEYLVAGVLKEFQTGHTSMISDQITEKLYELEGRQEGSMEQFMSGPMPEAADKDPAAVKIRTIEKLLSASSFVSLEEETEEPEIADCEWVEAQVEQLIQELNQVFAKQSKPVVRAIMAKLLSAIPSVFRSAEELREYLFGSLESCSDGAERETCMELIYEIMEIEDALV